MYYLKLKAAFLLMGIVFSKIIFGYFKGPKIDRSSGVVYFAQKVFFKIKGCLSVIGVVCSILIFGYFKSPKISGNSGIVSFLNFKVFIYWRC